jgi:hypothetical protein
VDDRLVRLETAVEQLGSTIHALEQRVRVLEARPSGTTDAAVPEAVTDPPGARPGLPGMQRTGRDRDDPIAILSLIGRLFLVLAGGFFLRAMTEAGLLPPQLGIALAFVYGLLWLVLADRASQRGLSLSAAFHAAAFAMVAFPLIAEATTRFKVLPPAGAAAGLGLLTVLQLWVAWRRRLPAAAWIAVLAALPTSIILVLKTGHVLPFALQPIALGVATLWIGYELGWRGIRWPTALVANLVVAGLTLRALAPQYADTLQVALLLQWSLLGAYAISIAVRTVVRGGSVGWFEVGQTVAVLLVAYGGTLLLSGPAGARMAAIGLVTLALGALCYVVALRIIGRRADAGYNLYFYTTLALVLVLVGASFLIHAPGPAFLFAVLAVLATGLWARGGQLHMLLHGAVYLVAAVVACGGLAYEAGTLAWTPAGPWQQPDAALVFVLLASITCAGLAAARPAPEGGTVASGLRLGIVIACTWSVAGCLVGWLAPLLAGLDDRTVEPGALATVRTGVLAVGTLLVAWIGRHARFREWGWLLYPLLVVTGLKMVAQDFGQSRPATLFIALALYGAALIVAPRLRRARKAAGDPVPLPLAGASPR